MSIHNPSLCADGPANEVLRSTDSHDRACFLTTCLTSPRLASPHGLRYSVRLSCVPVRFSAYLLWSLPARCRVTTPTATRRATTVPQLSYKNNACRPRSSALLYRAFYFDDSCSTEPHITLLCSRFTYMKGVVERHRTGIVLNIGALNEGN